MENKQFAIKQVRRFAGLDYFPAEIEAVEEMVLAVMTAVSEDICLAGCDSIMLDARKCPKPSDIRRVMKSENERNVSGVPKTPLGALCPTCQSIGYVGKPGSFDRCPFCENGLEFPAILLTALNQEPSPKQTALTEERVKKIVRMGEIMSRI